MKSIIQNTQQVQSLLSGSTQIRVEVKEENHLFCLNQVEKDTPGSDAARHGTEQFSPYSPGETVFVKETWWQDINTGTIIYKADGWVDKGLVAWRSSVHMPESAARIFLEIVSVKVQRLQDIGEEDAVKTGIETNESNNPPAYVHAWKDYIRGGYDLDAIASYETLYESIHGPGSWDNNPWEWVYEVKVKVK